MKQREEERGGCCRPALLKRVLTEDEEASDGRAALPLHDIRREQETIPFLLPGAGMSEEGGSFLVPDKTSPR